MRAGMNPENYDKLVKSLYTTLANQLFNEGFEIDVTREIIDTSFLQEHMDKLPIGLAECYHFLNGMHLEWRKTGDFMGRLRLLKIEYLFDDDTVVPVDNHNAFVLHDDYSFFEANKISGCFRIVDMYDDRRQMGFFSDQKLNFRLYLRDGIYFWDLKLDFKGYIEMGFKAKFLFDWPTVLIRYENLKLNKNTGDFEETWNELHEYLPNLFNDFSTKEFFSLYESLKLDN
jgi:hypothetical protein